MLDRKILTEFGLNFCSSGLLLLHPKDIKSFEKQSTDAKELANDCHIYFIVKRPRLSYVPDSVIVGNGETAGKFQYVKDGATKEMSFSLRGEANADKIEISAYPHTTLSLIKDGELLCAIPAHLMSMMCDQIEDLTIRNLEVVYIGMSYADGKRSAKDRLLSHSTLQQVLADINHDSPEMEALIIMAQYVEPFTMMSFDGRDKSLKIEEDRDIVADLKKQNELITKDIEIALIEAGLISYFKPYYNDKYKNTFPNKNHKILESLYEIDFGALTIEMNTEEINSRLYSEKIGCGFHHIASVDLHDPSIRRSFFNLMNLEQGSNAPDHSGPIF